MSEEVDGLRRDRLAIYPNLSQDFTLKIPTIEVTVRGKKIRLTSLTLGLNEASVSVWWVFCMLQLNNPEIDRLLCEMKLIVTDADNQLVFDWQKGGWILEPTHEKEEKLLTTRGNQDNTPCLCGSPTTVRVE